MRCIDKTFTFAAMALKDSTERLYADIKRDFDKLSNIKEFGVQKYTTDWMLAKLGQQYYKSPKTIENIVFNRVTIVRSPQFDLFKSSSTAL